MTRARLLLLLLVLAAPAAAAPPDSSTTVPGPGYAAGGLHRFLYGSSYRDLWTAPVTVEVLDLETTAGGLTPSGTGGGLQTLGLRFTGADGRPFSFRGLDKNPVEVLPEELRSDFLVDIVQDQISSAFPSGYVAVPRLLDALDILHVDVRLVVLPDSPLLGEYRETFAGVIGTFEEWPNDGPGDAPGFAGATEVVSTEELYGILDADPFQRVDALGYLTCRFLDLLIGDWDRHNGQFRWANLGGGEPAAWRPIPEDRDQAFVRYDGFFLTAAREVAPQLTKFGSSWPGLYGATFNGRDMDRRFLAAIERSAWDSVAVSVRDRLTDAVIDDAVASLPESHRALRGEFLRGTLRWRRDRIPDLADRLYRHLIEEADVYGTDTADRFTATWLPGGDLDLERRAPDGTPCWRKRFRDGETREVRLHLGDGDDLVEISGDREGFMGIRVVSGEGADRVVDASRDGRTTVYDTRKEGGAEVVGAHLDTRPFDPPWDEDTIPPPDWAARNDGYPIAFFNSDLGFVFGVTWQREKYGFRSLPYRHKHELGLLVSIQEEGAALTYDYDQRYPNSPHGVRMSARLSGLEVLRFHGYGNDSPEPGPDDDFYKVNQSLVRFIPRYVYSRGKTEVSLGVDTYVSNTDDEGENLVSLTRPYGTGLFGGIGAGAMVEYDARDSRSVPRSGWRGRLYGEFFPETVDADLGSYGEVNALVTGYASTGPATLAGRVGGVRQWGTVPFFRAATLGGETSLRGFPAGRFSGDTSVFASTELRLRLLRFTLFVPGTVGLVLLADAGRVWFEGDSPGNWHADLGGGLSWSPVTTDAALVLTLAGSRESLRFYLGSGFHF